MNSYEHRKMKRVGYLVLSILLLLLVCSCGQVSRDVTAQGDKQSNSPVGDKDSELIKYLKDKNYAKVKELVKAGADLNVRDEFGQTVVQVAVSGGDEEILDFLLNSGANPNLEIKVGVNPLETSLLRDDDRLTYSLIKGGANIDTKIAGDRSILMEAMIKGKYEVATFLLDRGAKVNVPNRIDRTELFYASGRSPALLRLLLKKGADPNARDIDGTTPIFVAIQNNDLEFVRTLVDSGADLNAQDKEGWTPMKDALVFGCGDIIALLRDNGAR